MIKSAISGMHGNGRVVYKMACVEVKISGLSVLLFNTHGGAPLLLRRAEFTVPHYAGSKKRACWCFNAYLTRDLMACHCRN